ncbi:hypothetical protein ABZ345_46990 [Lentzea sp. NPDC005914]|uniref:hypothetical protein n=1 Tax=Lentzea sp. NPDC005914 TaxID=3154572 RepID=UPI0033F7384D
MSEGWFDQALEEMPRQHRLRTVSEKTPPAQVALQQLHDRRLRRFQTERQPLGLTRSTSNLIDHSEMAQQAIAMWPELPLIMQANQALLCRAVRFCADAGVVDVRVGKRCRRPSVGLTRSIPADSITGPEPADP